MYVRCVYMPHVTLYYASVPHLTSLLLLIKQVRGIGLAEARGPFSALLLEFGLPSATYATMCLRELLKDSTRSSQQANLNELRPGQGHEDVDVVADDAHGGGKRVCDEAAVAAVAVEVKAVVETATEVTSEAADDKTAGNDGKAMDTSDK
jgi:hypothetical protein